MVQIVQGHDGALRAIAYLARFFGDAVQPEVPANVDWSTLSEPLIVVVETGGPGLRDVVFDDVRLSVEVFAVEQHVASERAHEVRGLLRAWPGQEAGVYFMGEIMRPIFQPHEPSRTPGYLMTVSMSFRGVEKDMPPI